MRILVLIGSLRTNSFNRKIAEAYEELAGERARFIEGDYSKFPLYSEDIQKNGFPPEVEQLAQQVREADGVLFVSPEYNYSVPGALKNALDWLSRLKDQPFAKKPATVIGASMGSIGTARMQYHLRQIGVFLDLHFMVKPEVMVGQVQNLIGESGKLTDEKTLKHLSGHFEAFREFVGAEVSAAAAGTEKDAAVPAGADLDQRDKHVSVSPDL